MAKTKVLLIEPDSILARTYREYLESFNASVSICGNSQEAINSIDKQMPDLIILEVQLSVHNGFEFLYELRSYPEWQSIPVVINSVIHPENLGLNSYTKLQLGINEVIYKPSCSLAKLLYSTKHYALAG